MRQFILETYPNNEVRIGWNDLPCRPRSGADGAKERERERAGRSHDVGVETNLAAMKKIRYRDTNGVLYDGNHRTGFERFEVDPHKLDIIREVQQKDSAAGRARPRDYSVPCRPTAFTRNARHRLLEGGSLFDSVYSSTHKGYFVTFTLPGSSEQAYDALARWSGYMANRVLQVVRRRCPGAIWFYVWELQKRGALHLHLFLALKREEANVDVATGLRDTWYRALRSIQDAESVDMFRHAEGDFCTASQFWQFDFQEVTKSPAAYISKYVGKSAESPRTRSDLEGGKVKYFPHRWWGMCRELTQAINAARFKVCMDAMTDDDCIHAIEEIDAEMQANSPVAQTEYVAEIGTDRESGRSIGQIFRRVFWFSPETFAWVDLLVRKLAVTMMQRIPSHLRRWWYGSMRYMGACLSDLLPQGQQGQQQTKEAIYFGAESLVATRRDGHKDVDSSGLV